MTFVQVMALWTFAKMMAAINQLKTTNNYVFDKYFKSKGKQALGTTAKLRIKRKASTVLKALAAGADRLVREDGEFFEITIQLPRFGQSAEILAHEINELETLEGEALVQAVSKKINELMTEHKEDYMTTIEFMATGALFGKVIDGDGVVLFEFTTDDAPIEYKNQDHITVLDQIDDALTDELGKTVPYEILASPIFVTRLASAAKTAGELDKNGNAYWDEDENGIRTLVYHSKRYTPFRAKWKDENGNIIPFIADGEAVVIPNSTDVFEHVYGKADHTDAMNRAPELFFASQPEKLGKGKGWGFETETKVIPYCVRPGALIKLKYSA